MMAMNSAQSQMEPTPAPRELRVPLHCVCPEDKIWDEMRGDPTFPLPEEVLRASSGGNMNSWLLLVYHWFRAVGCAATIGPEIRDNAINLVSARGFRRSYRMNPAFFLTVRADAHAQMMANFVMYQNGKFPERRDTANVIHWQQSGMIPRDPGRGNAIKVLSYMGTPQNLHHDFQSDMFRAALKDIGVELDLRFRNQVSGQHAWEDYSKTDVVLAVRGNSRYMAGIKPCTKLSNAWFAGVPAFVGPEPAYLEVWQSELDFFEAHRPEQVIAGIKRLRDEPGLYAAMVANGHSRSGPYTNEAIVDQWIDIINTKVAPEYERWHARPTFLKWPFMATGIALEPLMKALHDFRIKYGRRLIS
jgi:hypothetical protein